MKIFVTCVITVELASDYFKGVNFTGNSVANVFNNMLRSDMHLSYGQMHSSFCNMFYYSITRILVL